MWRGGGLAGLVASFWPRQWTSSSSPNPPAAPASAVRFLPLETSGDYRDPWGFHVEIPDTFGIYLIPGFSIEPDDQPLGLAVMEPFGPPTSSSTIARHPRLARRHRSKFIPVENKGEVLVNPDFARAYRLLFIQDHATILALFDLIAALGTPSDLPHLAPYFMDYHGVRLVAERPLPYRPDERDPPREVSELRRLDY
jgi:hypothetical protein